MPLVPALELLVLTGFALALIRWLIHEAAQLRADDFARNSILHRPRDSMSSVQQAAPSSAGP